MKTDEGQIVAEAKIALNVFQRAWQYRHGPVGLIVAAALGGTLWAGVTTYWHSTETYRDLIFLHAARLDFEAAQRQQRQPSPAATPATPAAPAPAVPEKK